MRHTHTATSLIVLLLCCVNYAFAKRHAPTLQRDEGFKDGYVLPQATYLKTMGLNFDTFTSSMVWIAGLLYYGEYTLAPKKVRRSPEHLQDYTQTMIDIDPRYEEPYHWFASTYLFSRKKVEHEDLERINDFMDIAIQRFPTKSNYLYDAGMHYIGYSVRRDPATRIKELEKGIDYLERASQFNNVSEDVPFTVGYMYRLKGSLERKLKGEAVDSEQDAQAQRQFYIDLYKTTTDTNLRGRLRKKLVAVGVPEEAIVKLEPAGQDKLQRRYARKRPYLPLDVWMLVESFEDIP